MIATWSMCSQQSTKPTRVSYTDGQHWGGSLQDSRDTVDQGVLNREPTAHGTPRSKRKKADKHEATRAEWRSMLDVFDMAMPSDLNARVCSHDAIGHPVQCELELRKGYAAEALDSLRVHLMTFATLEDRRKQVSSVKRNTN